jgi:hypothetical protein
MIMTKVSRTSNREVARDDRFRMLVAAQVELTSLVASWTCKKEVSLEGVLKRRGKIGLKVPRRHLSEALQ